MIEMNIRDLLETSYAAYHQRSFVDTDPVQIPHRYHLPADIEIAAFLTCTIAWGQRKTIIRNAGRLMDLLENEPHAFLTRSSRQEWSRFNQFVHRTFQPADLLYFLDALRQIYLAGQSLESLFVSGYRRGGIFEAIMHFRQDFLNWQPLPRTLRHVSDPSRGSAAKRLNLMLMWLCRQDDLGIHFGIWKDISPADLIIPLDVHVGRVARSWGLLSRRADDWRAALELTGRLREYDPHDPVRFDFSLFCTGLSG